MNVVQVNIPPSRLFSFSLPVRGSFGISDLLDSFGSDATTQYNDQDNENKYGKRGCNYRHSLILMFH